MVLMLRAIGVPARVVSGYLGGEYNKYGQYYIVRQSDAHTWVEAAIEGTWVSFDPTPPEPAGPEGSLFLYLDLVNLNWNRYVIGFSRYDQIELFNLLAFRPGIQREFDFRLIKNVNIPIYTGISILFLFVLLLVLKRRRPKHLSGISKPYVIVKRRLSKRTFIKNSSTSREIYDSLKGLDEEKRSQIYEFFDLYNKLRYGGKAERISFDRYRELYRILMRGLH
jgi:hypothetical protein